MFTLVSELAIIENDLEVDIFCYIDQLIVVFSEPLYCIDDESWPETDDRLRQSSANLEGIAQSPCTQLRCHHLIHAFRPLRFEGF